MITTVYPIQRNVGRLGRDIGRRRRGATYFWLVLQAVCRLLCWFPIQVLLVVSLSGAEVAPELVAWFTVLLMSLNSLINPILYTLRTIEIRTK